MTTGHDPNDFGRARIPVSERARSVEWGNAIAYGWIDGQGDTPEERRRNGHESSLTPEKVKAYLHNDAREVLWPGARYEVRAMIPLNFGRTKGMAWYRNAKMDRGTLEEWLSEAPGLRDGYMLVERCVTQTEAITQQSRL